MLKRPMIERHIPRVGEMTGDKLSDAAAPSNAALAQLKGAQRRESDVAGDKTFCVHLAESEAAIRERARLSGFPASRITEMRRVIDPTPQRARERRQAA